MIGGKPEVIWHHGSFRCVVYLSARVAGIEVDWNWPYTVRDPGWILPGHGLELPTVATIVGLAIAPFLKYFEVEGTPRTSWRVRRAGISLVVGICAFVSMVGAEFHYNGHLNSVISLSFGVALPVILIWLGGREMVLLLVRRRTPGYCEGCGYDLRATPERCPECGRVVG
jgi:hypothetical protein